MISIARKTLLHDWKRYLAAIVALAFSGLLMLVQVGLLYGMFGSITVLVDNGSADLWVTSRGAQGLDASAGVPQRYEGRFWMHPDVVDVRPLAYGGGDWRKGDVRKPVMLYGLDLRPGALAAPKGLSDGLVAALAEPGAVIVDRSDLAGLGVEVGDSAEINRQRVRIVGAVSGYRGMLAANVFASAATLRQLGAAPAGDPPFYMIRLRPDADTRTVARDLQPRDGAAAYSVWRAADLSKATHAEWMAGSGSGAAFAFSAVIALIIGAGVTSQTLRGATLASLREFAALRALGIGIGRLRRVLLEQALWTGAMGLAASAAMLGVVALVCAAAGVPIAFPPSVVAAVAACLMAIALLSGVASLGVLYRSQPADLLR
ncbi:MAG: ABC transporter permease [Alphaproteobacteria bacterium]|nr:ABC transporter permease [Alphaproteobacteria bacterium]